MAKFDMEAGKVTLDLTALNKSLGFATAELHQALSTHLSTIWNELRKAQDAAQKGDYDVNYRELCHANTGRKRLVTLAQQLANAIECQFHVNEACKRDEVAFAGLIEPSP